MNGINSNMIGNLVSQFAVNKFKLDMNYSMIISMMVSSALISADISMITRQVTSTRISFAIFLAALVYVSKIVYDKYNRPAVISGTKYKCVKIYRNDECGLVRYMMKTHPEFYDRDYDMEIANPKYETQGRYYIPEIDTKVNFNDKKFGVKGFIRYESSEVQNVDRDGNKKEGSQPVRCMAVYLEKSCPLQGDEYMAKIQKYRDEVECSSDHMRLWSVKVMARTSGGDSERRRDDYNHYVEMYQGSRKNHEERRKKWFGSFFSPHKDRLWDYLSNIHYKPEVFHRFGQGARCNLLLHGPPGTGKSTFVYRLAMSLGRHIISIDLTALGDDRTKIYQVVQSPRVKEYTMTPNKYIVLLEEFDIAVTHLKEKNKRPDFSSMWKMYGSHKTDVESESDETKEPPTLYSRSTREFELEDLLEILQGPVPLEGSIIIATTNKYEEIKDICPALFRPGRLTPVEFGYLDWASLQEMSRHYFGKDLTFGPIDEITICSSEIVEIAMAASFKGEKGFAHFESALRGKLSMS
jgi:hypothetical protein